MSASARSRGARVMVSGRLEQRTWETQDGDKRSKIEVVADEVGPSLRWATAEVKKATREKPVEGAQKSTSSSGASGWGEDEEPF